MKRIGILYGKYKNFSLSYPLAVSGYLCLQLWWLPAVLHWCCHATRLATELGAGIPVWYSFCNTAALGLFFHCLEDVLVPAVSYCFSLKEKKEN